MTAIVLDTNLSTSVPVHGSIDETGRQRCWVAAGKGNWELTLSAKINKMCQIFHRL